MDEELERAIPLLEGVIPEAERDLIVSLVVADDEEKWLLERLGDALQD
jgi:hypothetical protein